MLWLITTFFSFDLLFFGFYFEVFFFVVFLPFILVPLSKESSSFAILSVLSMLVDLGFTIVLFWILVFLLLFSYFLSVLASFFYYFLYIVIKLLAGLRTRSVKLFSDRLGATSLFLLEILLDKYYITYYLHFFSQQGHYDSPWYLWQGSRSWCPSFSVR